MREENDNRGLVGFLTIWAGQLVSVVGSGLTSFALGVWVLEKTGSSFSFRYLLRVPCCQASCCCQWQARSSTAGIGVGS